MQERRGGSRRLAGVARAIVVFLVTVALAEATARAFWRVRYGIPLSRPATILRALYPELQQLEWKDEDLRWQRPVRILFLGGSVLHPAWGNVEQELRERLTVRLGRPVVVFNMAEIGHTSRDSDAKYRVLDGGRFDLVVFYHGINDARANNVPPERFRRDYSHYAWYDALRALETCRDDDLLVLPCTLRFLWVRANDALGIVDYVSMDAPRADWLAYGAEIKSAASFEENLRGVVARARARGEPLLLLTFATHLPDDYSLQAFNERRLDYTIHLTPIEMWGTPQNVLAAVARHNEIVRSAAASNPDVRLFDQASAMPKGARYFNDVCHLTATGSSVFVQNMVDTAVEIVSAPRGAR
ncbi:MAG TPA: GDSL-type esterase/lipase family protein [Candidatus Binatia bacterium]|nr:GDSL-type esterase/lipase family protein [Candidatus Binatia bacterium]